ncbi:[FeFe] hydrogenase H-cluster radical SAM maturase HydE [Candidatus Gastranaerophilus sp. (ex Termes propinquus)]|nr:[FeFe] hydrogenase H-cluster radical SAM maturase HydE [Candidatus Gastranaerophilus sp. (ex Termes propinquus)]
MSNPVDKIIEKAENTHELEKEEIITLLQKGGSDLFSAADRVRAKYLGDAVHLRGLIEFSNICAQNCLYCGIRRDNEKIKRYRLEPESIFESAKNAADLGYKTIVLQSGEDAFFSAGVMSEVISEIKKLNIAITLSIGEKSYEEYRAYKEAGANRYLVRIETTDVALYEKMHPNMSFQNRVKCLKYLGELGYEVGCGSLVGLPGQTIESLAGDILFFKEIGADMVGLGPFIVNENTPLEGYKTGDNFTLSLKMMAITRLLMPDINIPATTAMENLNVEGRMAALQSGANVIMPNVTGGKCRELYELYPGKVKTGEDVSEYRKHIEGKIKTIGRFVSEDFGFRATCI